MPSCVKEHDLTASTKFLQVSLTKDSEQTSCATHLAPHLLPLELIHQNLPPPKKGTSHQEQHTYTNQVRLDYCALQLLGFRHARPAGLSHFSKATWAAGRRRQGQVGGQRKPSLELLQMCQKPGMITFLKVEVHLQLPRSCQRIEAPRMARAICSYLELQSSTCELLYSTLHVLAFYLRAEQMAGLQGLMDDHPLEDLRTSCLRSPSATSCH